MKPVFAIYYLVALFCIVSCGKKDGITIAIGHVTTEMVKSVSVNPKVVTYLNLENSDIESNSSK